MEADKTTADKTVSCNTPEYVVGVGASAGGLEALERFFEKMPTATGLAFVVVQHLSPDFKSLMDELLGRRTSIPVVPAQDGMPVTENTIFLMPPRNQMIISGGKLLLSDKEPAEILSLPIDQFFRSLAQDFGRHSVGVILSGTGSDGSRGIRNIHEAGGLVLVQSEESAKFNGMPKSAIETGVVDESLPPEMMASALLRHINHPAASDLDAGLVLESGGEMAAVFRLLRLRYGIDFSYYKPSTVIRRTERRLTLKQLHSLEEYVEQLNNDPAELDSLYHDLLIGVTQFFRDQDAFRVIERDVLPELLAQVPDQGELRVWIAGCATGEEAYSLAILIRENLETLNRPINAKVFATDVHKASLDYASVGVYPPKVLENVPAEWVEKYFTRVNDRFQVSPDLRKLVVFAPHNIIKDAPFTRLDLISCRNLLIYLQPIAQRKAISLFHFGLRTGGVLFMGPSETLGDLANEFEEIDRHWRVLRKRRDIRLPEDLRLPLAPGNVSELSRDRPVRARSSDSVLFELFSGLLDQSLPSSVLINDNREVVHSFGDVARLLRVRRGRPSLDLLDLLPDDLKVAVASALQRTLRTGQPSTFSQVRTTVADNEQLIDVTVTAVSYRRNTSSYYLVSFAFSTATLLPSPPDKESGTDDDLVRATRDRIETLENELRYTRESLQATVEELETANEEMQATNEELLASNEELQSTNEELHSVNEELYTVNAEFQKKIDELTELTNDINNLLTSTDLHTVFLDQNLCIRKFTPKMADVFHLIPNDLGRRIESFASKIRCVSLVDKLTQVLSTGDRYEEEVTSIENDSFLMRILPYQGDPRRSGVVLTLNDLTSHKQAEARFRRLFELSPSANLIANSQGRIVLVNDELERLFGYEHGELLGELVQVLLPHHLREKHRELFKAYLEEPTIRPMGVNRPIVGLSKEGSELSLEIKLGPLQGSEGLCVVASISDVSHRRRLEASLRDQVEQRDRFLAMLSHELRNPLAAAGYSVSLLQKLASDDEPLREPCAVISRQIAQMSRLLDDLLDVSRIAQGKITLRIEACDIRALCREALETLEPMISEHQHTVRLECPNDSVFIHGDKSRLLQVLGNLLTNSIKYTPNGGSITLSIDEEPAVARIRVRDNGRGIPTDRLESIFDLFSQVDDSLDRSEGGMGVGLTLVRRLIELHGGKISAHSEGPGTGSEFVIRLPTTAQRPILNVVNPDSTTTAAQSLRLVLVEDNPDIRNTLTTLLQMEGHEVQAAVDGSTGLDLILKTRPNLALIDIGLPDLDGFQLASRLRAAIPRGELPLIAVTGYGRDTDRQKVLDAGFDHHLVKPIDFDQLQKLLRTLTSTSKTESTIVPGP